VVSGLDLDHSLLALFEDLTPTEDSRERQKKKKYPYKNKSLSANILNVTSKFSLLKKIRILPAEKQWAYTERKQ